MIDESPVSVERLQVGRRTTLYSVRLALAFAIEAGVLTESGQLDTLIRIRGPTATMEIPTPYFSLQVVYQIVKIKQLIFSGVSRPDFKDFWIREIYYTLI